MYDQRGIIHSTMPCGSLCNAVKVVPRLVSPSDHDKNRVLWAHGQELPFSDLVWQHHFSSPPTTSNSPQNSKLLSHPLEAYPCIGTINLFIQQRDDHSSSVNPCISIICFFPLNHVVL